MSEQPALPTLDDARQVLAAADSLLAGALGGPARRWAMALAMAAAANAPWVVAGLLHAGSATTTTDASACPRHLHDARLAPFACAVQWQRRRRTTRLCLAPRFSRGSVRY